MKRYNKLVRDKIPEHLDNLGKRYRSYIADNSEYTFKLKQKLIEEVLEYQKQSDVEELVDIQEVINAILENKNISKEDFEKIRKEKTDKKGAFKRKIILIEAEK